MSTLSLKKVLIVALFGAVLFAASFIVSGKMNADPLNCQPTGSVFNGVFGAPQCSAAPAGQSMMASYYGFAHAGNPTASGDVLDPMQFTAAHKTMPFGTRLLVSREGRSATVVVNDRGPFTGGRDLDVSQAAADSIGLTGPGVAPVEVTVL